MVSVTLKPSSSHRGSYYPEMNPLYASGLVNWRLEIRPTYWRPPTDLYETEDKFVIRVEVAGMRDGEFSVSIDDNVLTISGLRSDVSEPRSFHQMEIHFGEFTTQVELPSTVDINRVTAEYEDGFLHVVLPKAHPKQVIVGNK